MVGLHMFANYHGYLPKLMVHDMVSMKVDAKSTTAKTSQILTAVIDLGSLFC